VASRSSHSAAPSGRARRGAGAALGGHTVPNLFLHGTRYKLAELHLRRSVAEKLAPRATPAKDCNSSVVRRRRRCPEAQDADPALKVGSNRHRAGRDALDGAVQ